jgi:hypothetical protein
MVTSTNLVRNPQFVYDDIYVLRGDVENRIKELKLELKADRLSCHRFLANQFRLLLHTAAYCLFYCCATTSRGRNWRRPKSTPYVLNS